MTEIVEFLVSTPCNNENEPSGYRVIELKDNELSLVKVRRPDPKFDKDVTTQAFCYLRPKDREIVPQSLTSGIIDCSDYLFIGKSNGLIEVIQDYQYRSEKNLSLDPDYLLACIPENYIENVLANRVVVNIEYKDGLLYCSQSSGGIYVFILNLPSDYEQVDNYHNISNEVDKETNFENDELTKTGRTHPSTNVNIPSDSNSRINNDTRDTIIADSPTYSELNDDLHCREINDLYKETQYTGRSPLKHLCYFLIPHTFTPSNVKKTLDYYMSLYHDIYIYRPSIRLVLEQGISQFHINPFDRLSFLTASPGSPLMIRKIVLPLTYLNYLLTYITLKKRVQQLYVQEVIPWEKLAIENGFHSFAYWLAYESVYGYESVSSTLWDAVVQNQGTGCLKSTIVWKQASNSSNDDKIEKFYREIHTDLTEQDDQSDINDYGENFINDDYITSFFDHIDSPDFIDQSPNINGINSNRDARRRNNFTNTFGASNDVNVNISNTRHSNFSDNSHLRSNLNPTRRSSNARLRRNNRLSLNSSFRRATYDINSFVRRVKRNTFLCDFKVINESEFYKSRQFSRHSANNGNVSSISNSNNSSNNSSTAHNIHLNNSIERMSALNSQRNHDNETLPSFLIDKYKNMYIVGIDKFLILSVFKPKYQDEETLRLEVYHNRSNTEGDLYFSNNNTSSNNKCEETHNIFSGYGDRKKGSNDKLNNTEFENDKFTNAILRLTSFKKVFILTDLLCLILDTCGVLLVDINNITDPQNLSNNHLSAIKIAPYDIGLINDAIVTMAQYDTGSNVIITRFSIIVTCLPGEIKAFKVDFNSNSKIGRVFFQDCLRLTSRDRFVDKLSLIYHSAYNKTSEKRSGSDEIQIRNKFIKKVKMNNKFNQPPQT